MGFCNEGMTDVMGTVYVKLKRVMGVTQVESESHNACVHSDSFCHKRRAGSLSDSAPSCMDPYLCLQCMCGGDEWVK